MTVQQSDTVRNARLDALETAVGASPYLDLRTGAQPSDCAQADSGTELVHIALPSDWMAAASGGSKVKSGTWSGTGIAAGSVGHYRLKNNADSVCHEQGSVTATGGGGDLELDNISIAVSQTVTINTWTYVEGAP